MYSLPQINAFCSLKYLMLLLKFYRIVSIINATKSEKLFIFCVIFDLQIVSLKLDV